MPSSPYRYDFMSELGRAVDGSIQRGKDGVRDSLRATNLATRGRPVTLGEQRMIQWMFGTIGGMARARIYPHNFWWPYPNQRAMTPDGNIYFPGSDYRDDFSLPTVSLVLRALFMHEATHLYQWYVLRQWVFVRGPFDRNYRYDLVPGQPLKDYGLEQMGQIVQDFYILTNGGAVRDAPYKSADYKDALPVRASR